MAQRRAGLLSRDAGVGRQNEIQPHGCSFEAGMHPARECSFVRAGRVSGRTDETDSPTEFPQRKDL